MWEKERGATRIRNKRQIGEQERAREIATNKERVSASEKQDG